MRVVQELTPKRCNVADGKTLAVIGSLVWELFALWSPVHAGWSTEAGSDVAYTDNVFQFSSAFEQEMLDDPTLPSPGLIQKRSDVIWEPMVKAVWSGRPGGRPLEVGVKAQGFVYTDHPIFNHGDYRAHLRRWLSPASSIWLRYQYEPNLFLQPNFEHRTGANLIQDERVTSHIGSVEFEHRLTDTWDFMLEGRYGVRLYNEAFAERDTRFWTLGPELKWSMHPQTAITLGYLYERGLADGRGDVRFDDDVSYRNHLVSLAIETVLMQSLALHLSYIYRCKDFTSDLAGDTEHRGRQDETNQGNAELRYRFNGGGSLTLGFKRTERASTNQSFSFNSTVISTGFLYRF